MTSDIRRRTVYGNGIAGARSLKVPLWTDRPEGEWVSGFFDVSARIAYTQEHTNERYEFDCERLSNYRRWIEYRAKRGWFIVPKTLSIVGPQDIPTPTTNAVGDEERKRFIFTARFKRETPLYVGLDDYLERTRLAAQYQIEKPADPKPWNVVTTRNDTGWVDPMVEAEEERKRLGLKREDYLLGPLGEPWH